MTMSSIRPNRVEVVTSVQRRRRWTPEQKLEIVKQTNEPGSSVSLVARQYGLVTPPKNENNMKIEASIYLRIRNEEVKVHGKSNFRMPHKHGLYKFLDGQCFLGGGKLVSLAA